MSENIFETNSLTGELLELRDKLDGNDANQRKSAVKRVISMMRAGENVSILFSSMLRCIQTDDIELKRLVYIYILQYSSHKEEESIMAVSAMIKDSTHFNPLIRALAIRTMTRIRNEAFAENIVTQMKRCLEDEDPFVRKTAVLGVSKLYSLIPEQVENLNLFDSLIKCLMDVNPLVIANTAATISSINKLRSKPIYKYNSNTILNLANAIESSSEWCQITLLDCIAEYEPESPEEARNMIERVIPFLNMKNPSVVIASFKCILRFMDYDDNDPETLYPRIIPAVLALVCNADTNTQEIQFCVLRTLSLFSQKYPKALSKEHNMFYCKYNDPSYIKLEKLNIIVNIAQQSNLPTILNELEEYCNEVDVQFVRKSIQCVGIIATEFAAASRKCVDILVHLIDGKADYAIEESIIVLTNLLRKYPSHFEGIISHICQSAENLKSAEAKISFIWILGEYCHLIDSVDVIIDQYIDSFVDETPSVQLAIITSIVKIYLNNQEQAKDQLQYILDIATNKGEHFHPDVTNRAMFYWRLFSSVSSQEDIKQIIKVEKTQSLSSKSQFSEEVLDNLIRDIGLVSGVLYLDSSSFNKNIFDVDKLNDGGSDEDDYQNSIQYSFIRTSSDIFELYGAVTASNIYFRMRNKKDTNLNNFAIAMNKNSLNIVLTSTSFPKQDLSPNEEMVLKLPYAIQDIPPSSQAIDPSFLDKEVKLEFAIRTNQGNCFFNMNFNILDCVEKNIIKKKDFLDQMSKFYSNKNETPLEYSKVELTGVAIADDEELVNRKICIVSRNQQTMEVCLCVTINKKVAYIQIQYVDKEKITIEIVAEKEINYLVRLYPKTLFCIRF